MTQLVFYLPRTLRADVNTRLVYSFDGVQVILQVFMCIAYMNNEL